MLEQGLRGVKLAAASSLLLLSSCIPSTSPEDASFRDSVLNQYGVTPHAQEYIRQYPFKNTHTTTNGGGMTYPDRFEVYSDQHEALLHEASHIYAKHLMNPDFCGELDKGLKAIADRQESDYYIELYYGDGAKFKGLKGNCTEQYASMSSYSMGQEQKLPVDVRWAYQTLYEWGK